MMTYVQVTPGSAGGPPAVSNRFRRSPLRRNAHTLAVHNASRSPRGQRAGRPRSRASLLAGISVAMLAACQPLSPGGDDGPHLTHGIAAGEVTATSAVVWGRCDRSTALRVQLGDAEHSTDVTDAGDFTGKIALTGLSAGQH